MYVFDTDEQDVPKAVTEKKVAEIAADFMTSYYGIQVGALETQEFRTTPLPFCSFAFRTRSRDHCDRFSLSSFYRMEKLWN
jgi:hypothetical protein